MSGKHIDGSYPPDAGTPRARTHLQRFVCDERGTTTIISALTWTMALFVIAMAIDYGRSELEQQRIQRATDAAALAASHHLGTPDQDTAGPAAAKRFFDANVKGNVRDVIETVKLDAAKGEVRINSNGSVLNSLLNAFGYATTEVRAASRVIKGDGTVEIALVLDNSGSMAGQSIIDLTTAAQNLTNTIFLGASSGVGTEARVKMAVVPFSAAVNVGAQYRTAAWMDQDGISPANAVNLAENVPRFALYDRMGVAWRGCVEVRPAPYDTQDVEPSLANPATMFVPMFAPDEPDSINAAGASYSNNYIADDGGTCPPQDRTCVSYNRRGSCTNWQVTPIAATLAQSRTCKYQDATPSGAGPNYMCESRPLQSLTADKSLIDSTLSGMIAKGNTNIMEGVMWGWRVLSPAGPFGDGRAYDSPKNDKIMILMTDGANTYSASSNHNHSSYGAFNYGSADRLGTTYTSAGYVAQMNAKTRLACTNAKAAGVKIYTIAFRLESDPTTLSMLRDCASEPTMAFLASNGASLVQVFEMIAREITQMRVAN